MMSVWSFPGVLLLARVLPSPQSVPVTILQGNLARIKSPPPLGPYSRALPRALWWAFFMRYHSTGQCPPPGRDFFIDNLGDHARAPAAQVPLLSRVLPHHRICHNLSRKVDIRLPGAGNSNSHGARLVHQIVSMMKWIRTTLLARVLPHTESVLMRGQRGRLRATCHAISRPL